MNPQEKTDNQLPEEITPSDRDLGNEIVYIAELNGEFFTVDYQDEDDDPTVTPLKIVEFINPTEQATNDEVLPVPRLTESDEPTPQIASSTKTSAHLPSVEKEPKIEPEPQPSSIASSKPKFSGRKGLAIGVGLGILATLIGVKLLSARSTPEAAVTNVPTELPSPQARSVTVAQVETGSVDRTIEVSGTVQPLELVPVTSEVTGLQIQEILVGEGAQVNKGQVLARLKDNTLQAEYLQAQATVDGAQARLAELEAGTRSEEISRAQERVNSATAEVQQAQSDLELVSKRVKRNRTLQAEGAISLDRLDEINNQERISRANLSKAKASLQEAQQELQQLKTGARPEVIAGAKADLAKAQGQLEYASVQLDNTVIRAVTNGIIAERNVKVGNLTSPSETLFEIIEDGDLELQLQVPETDLNQIRPGQSVKIFDPNSDPIIGTVREIDPIVDSESRQAIVKVSLPSGNNLQPGMFLEAAITTSSEPGTFVPLKALLPQTENNAIAFVVRDNNTVEARSVKMGDILPNNQIEVLMGLETGEYVVVEGSAYLKDGDKISIENDLSE